MRTERLRVWVVCGAFLLAAVWFFVPVGKPEGANVLFAMRLALPAAVLAVGGIGLLPWLMTAGFVFCAIGDAMGVLGSFEGQMGGFALAHVCFIIWLAKQVQRVNGHPSLYIISSVCFIPLFVAAVRIIPEIKDTTIRIGCIIYSLLLTGTLWTSWLRMASARTANPLQWKRPLLTALGATSFFISDFVLSWNKFVAPVTNSRIVIMTTYYAALMLLFMGEAYKNKKNSLF